MRICLRILDVSVTEQEERMNTVSRTTKAVVGLVLMLTAASSWAGPPPNYDVSDQGNTAGGTGAVFSNTSGIDLLRENFSEQGLAALCTLRPPPAIPGLSLLELVLSWRSTVTYFVIRVVLIVHPLYRPLPAPLRPQYPQIVCPTKRDVRCCA